MGGYDEASSLMVAGVIDLTGCSGGMVWSAVEVRANEEKGEWGEVRAETRRELGESESESRDKREKITIKKLDTHTTVPL